MEALKSGGESNDPRAGALSQLMSSDGPKKVPNLVDAVKSAEAGKDQHKKDKADKKEKHA